MSKNYSLADGMVSLLILLIGAAEAAHLFGVFFHRPFSQCVLLFGGFAAAALVLMLGIVLWLSRKKKTEKAEVKAEKSIRTQQLSAALFGVMVLLQIVFIVFGAGAYRQGDMTVETVGSFLQTDGVYQVNPLTGRAYEGGIPSRLKILCLPTMYGALCSIFGVEPEVLVWHVVPVLVLFGCYGAYICLGRCLFPENPYRQQLFLVIVALVFLAGGYALGVDGFNLMYSGWRGVTLRNAVLVPYTLSLCLRKKYLHALLCVVAEACVVWTLYGMGACLLVILGMMLADFLWRKHIGREEAEK